MRKPVCICILAALLVAASASSQPVQGDIVLSSEGPGPGVFYTSWPSTSLGTVSIAMSFSGIRTAHGNLNVYVTRASNGNLYKMSSTGSLTTVTSKIPPGAAALGLDQDGACMVANSKDHRLYRAYGSEVSTFLTLGASDGHPNAICRMGDVGDWLVGTTNGSLIKVSRWTSLPVVIYRSTTPSGISGVAYMPQTGEYAVVRSLGTIQELAIISPTGTVRATREIENANAVTVNHKTGRMYVATSTGSVVELSGSASVLASRNFGSHGFTGIDIWGDQNVSLSTSGDRGSQARIYMCFPRSKNMPYAVALSQGQRPGIAFSPENVLNIQLDTVFFLTAAGRMPLWTSGFTGKTDKVTGNAYATFTVPFSISTYDTLYVGAVAVNAAFPDGLDVGNVECVQVK